MGNKFWERLLPNLEVGPQISAASILSTLKKGKDQKVMDYFIHVMQL